MDESADVVMQDTPDLDQGHRDLDQTKNKSFEHPWIDAKSQIRLLQISNIDGNPPRVDCSLIIVNIDDLASTDYAALSYTWGEARTVEDVHQIFVDDQPFWVRTNLWSFFQSCRSLDLTIPIYIDAICLNQLNQAERGDQVKLMSRVYSNANHADVWLGSVPGIQEHNLQMLRRQLSEGSLQSAWQMEALVGLSYICSRNYWQRLWIVQELLLSNSATLHCGPFAFTWDELVQFAKAPDSESFADVPDALSWWEAWDLQRPRDFTMQSETESHLRGGWQYALRLFRYRRSWQSRTLDSSQRRTDDFGLAFHQAISAFQHQRCQDKKDKIYALVGLLNTEGKHMIKPNYQSSLAEVYIEAAAAGFVSRWREASGPPDSLRHEDRKFCDMLDTTLGLQSKDLKARVSRAVKIAVSYMKGVSNASLHLTPDAEDIEDAIMYEVEEDAAPDWQAPESSGDSTPAEPFLQRAFREFRNSLRRTEAHDFAATTRPELNITIARIQNKQQATGTLQNLTRLKAFLDATTAYSDLVDACVGERDVVNLIWGPIKVLLQTTVRKSEAFDGLLALYERLGTTLPAFARIQSLSDLTDRHEVVGVLFGNIFHFHKLALHFFRNRAWQQLFDHQWIKLRSTLGERIEDMQAHKEVVDRQSDTVELEEARQGRVDNNVRFSELLEQAKQTRLEAEQRFNRLDADEIFRRKAVVFSWLEAADSASDQAHFQDIRKSCPNSGHWLLRTPRFRAWCDPQSVSNPTLWITGRPGAGKSVLASCVVDEAQELPDTTTLFFYCKHDEKEKVTFVGMARSILHQLLIRHDALLMSYLFDIASRRGETNLRTIKLAKEVLTTCLKAVGKTCVVIDGLDECRPVEQQQHIAKFWMSYVEDSSSHPESSRCVMFSQDDETTRPLFAKLPTIRIHGNDHNQDISAFCYKELENFREEFELTPRDKAWIVAQTAEFAQGMFLHARLVMTNLSLQWTREDLDYEMTRGIFPKGIEDGYSRIIERILKRAPDSHRKHAHRLLALVACATRPLKWREVQAAVSIDSASSRVDYERHKLMVDFKTVCGALVDELPNGDMTFAHATVKEYLTRSGHIDLTAEQAFCTKLCLDYLSLPHFSRTYTDDQIRSALATGQFALMEYAAVSWSTHLEAPLEASSENVFPSTLEAALANFFGLHWRDPRKRSKPTKRITELTGLIIDLPIYDRTKDSMASLHCLMSTNLSDADAVQTSDIFAAIARVRTLMEGMAGSEASDAAVFKQFHGDELYKCPRAYCKWFHEGFPTALERKSHIEKHERAHYCSSPGCVYATLGYPTAKELAKHIAEAHQTGLTEEDFPDEVDEVEISDHEEATAPAMTELPQQPAKETGAPEPDPAETDPRPTVASNTGAREPEQRPKPIEPVKRRRKGPTTFQCELCPKKFTRAFGLKSHMRTHIDDRQYVCKTCGRKFNRQRDCKRHEELHDGQKKYSCYGPLKRGGHWGCNRRFARSDALSRHFRSEAGRACIQPLWDEQEAEKQRERIERQRRLPMPTGSNSFLTAPNSANAISGPPGYSTPTTLPRLSNLNFPDALLQQYPTLNRMESGASGQSITPDPSQGRSPVEGYDEAMQDVNDDYQDEETSYGHASGSGTQTPGQAIDNPYFVG